MYTYQNPKPPLQEKAQTDIFLFIPYAAEFILFPLYVVDSHLGEQFLEPLKKAVLAHSVLLSVYFAIITLLLPLKVSGFLFLIIFLIR